MSSGHIETIIIGMIFKTPELKSSEKGVFCNFSLGTVKSYKDADDKWQNAKNYHNCVAFGKTAEFICKSFKPKDVVRVVGEPNLNEYNGKSSINYTIASFQVIHRDYNNSQKYAETSSSGVDTVIDEGFDDTQKADIQDLPF